MEFILDRPNARRYQSEKILEELRRVAELYQHRRFSRRECDLVSTYCKGTVALARFGSWQAAIDAAGLNLVVPTRDRSRISNQGLFGEMERIWRKVGHRPSKDEWEFHDPAHSYTTYKTRFGGWLNACAAFIEHASDVGAEPKDARAIPTPAQSETAAHPSAEDRRGMPMKIRYRILVRDHFRCVLCGRNPALAPGVRLHVDHTIPFAKGGKTTEGNLRTLCEACNWGKGDEHLEA